jgi:hypothetical protein
VLLVLQGSTHTHTSEDVATNSERKRLNRHDTVELILDPDSDDDVSVCDQSE